MYHIIVMILTDIIGLMDWNLCSENVIWPWIFCTVTMWIKYGCLREKVVVNILVDTYCIAEVALFRKYYHYAIEERKLQTPTCFYRVLNRFLQDGFKLIVICWSIGNLQINCIPQIIRLYKLHHFSVAIQVKVYTLVEIYCQKFTT